MKNITVLDTNVILRYLLNDHPQHFERAQAFMADVISGTTTAYIPDSVLAECMYVLLKVYKVPKPKACEVLSGVLSYAGISPINGDILRTSLRLFAEHNVDIVDAIVHATAKQRDWDIFSFDQDMKKFS
ncbi:MAG: PIN domain-containing protein [Methylobacter sp.]